MSALQALAARREALQQEAEDQRRSLRRQADAIGQRVRPLRQAWRWAGTALLAWKLWRQWRSRR